MPIDVEGNGHADDPELADLVRFRDFRLVGPEHGGNTALIEAITSGRLRALVNDWAPLREPPETLLVHAVRSDDLDIARALLEAGAEPDRGITEPTEDEPNDPPLHDVESVAMTRLLLDAGADPNLRNGVGNPPLVSAISRSPDVAKLLLERGADPMGRDAMGESLASLSRREAPEIHRLLLPRVLEQLRTTEGRALLVQSARPTRDFITSFARPRMRARARWMVVTSALDADRLAELVLETHAGVRIERNAAARRVIAVNGAFVFHQRPCWHSTAILVSAARRLPDVDRARALARRAAEESGRPSHVVRSWSLEEVDGDGVRTLAADSGDLERSEATLEKEALAAMEDRCAELGIHLPSCTDMSDGLSCALEVQGVRIDDFDPFHVVVLEDHEAPG